MPHLFAYGTLRCEDILAEVVRCRPSSLPGVVHGYRCGPVKGEVYPGLVEEEDGQVEGVVYRDLAPAAWARLDRFEGDLYVRRPVPVALSSGASCEAETYLVRPQHRDRVGPGTWDFDAFLRTGKPVFQGHYQGYRSL
jgi:gamma-glutamylcyclotransferase (GGCT)/AIG2-like uncharacterized protein YtfP